MIGATQIKEQRSHRWENGTRIRTCPSPMLRATESGMGRALGDGELETGGRDSRGERGGATGTEAVGGSLVRRGRRGQRPRGHATLAGRGPGVRSGN